MANSSLEAERKKKEEEEEERNCKVSELIYSVPAELRAAYKLYTFKKIKTLNACARWCRE